MRVAVLLGGRRHVRLRPRSPRQTIARPVCRRALARRCRRAEATVSVPTRGGFLHGRAPLPAHRAGHPDALVQPRRRPADAAAAAAASRHRPARRPRRPRAALPDGADPARRSRSERWIPIPDPVRAVYAMWRPTPLHRALGPGAGARDRLPIFYKYEGVSPAGSHKPNTAVPQAFYNKRGGRDAGSPPRPAPASGARRCRYAGALFGLEVKVYMVRASYDAKPYRRSMIETWGAQVVPSPSPDTNAGRGDPGRDARTPRARSASRSREAVEDAATREDTKYALGSVLNHVLLHQTVIGQEAKKQLELAGAYPDVVDRLHRRRLELRRPRVPVPGRQAGRPRACASSPPSPRPARR